MSYNVKLVDWLLDRVSLPVETAERLEALHCILTADIRALPLALEVLCHEYKGRPPMRLDVWADAIDAIYLAGF